MSRYRNALPQRGGDLFLTDGGIETTLIFLDGLELPYFAAFTLLRTPHGEAALRKYFSTYAALASTLQTGLILETATWRASADWGDRLGYDATALAQANRRSVALLEDIRAEYETGRTPVVISGCIGPRGDGYVPDASMSETEAETYHRRQIDTFAGTSADLVTAITMNYCEEAVGIARAARTAGLPVVISFTVETDGRLPTGHALADAIARVDDATAGYPAYYMLNCAHPRHFEAIVEPGASWANRIRGLRANASRRSHAELNEAPDLDIGDPAELGADYAALRRQRLPGLNVMGGCCGTDHRHVEQIAAACLPLFRHD
ncbi:MAG TPA: homocysteine S-methyltransferase family protein [Tahibacter sp.]|uniref:homocysteine S-methyltransferase family protein n=1 Tax=Tahibacter sp. TaxID=2056211 RepID=UPI002B58E57E|nr:homocysteine S-methyltransferase family protein [Tahibacter sp.]HSX60495.1 homocysteine S-methyltransferase family protein [Tahibacter sp.]